MWSTSRARARCRPKPPPPLGRRQLAPVPHAGRRPCQVAWPVDGGPRLSLTAGRGTGGTGGTAPLAASLEMAADVVGGNVLLTSYVLSVI